MTDETTLPTDPHDAATSTRSGCASEFFSGLTKPTALSLLVAILVAVAIWATGASIVTKSWMAEHGEWFTDGPDDIPGVVTQQALAMTAKPPAVVIAGHLAGNRLAPDIQDNRLGRVVDLRTPSQTLFETLDLLDQLPAGSPARIVLVISSESLQTSTLQYIRRQSRRRIGVRSTAATVMRLQRGVEVVGLRGNYFVDNQSYLISRVPVTARNLVRRWLGKEAPSRGQTLPTPGPDKVHPTDDAGALVGKNLASLEQILNRLDRRDLRSENLVFWTDDPQGDCELRQQLEAVVRRHAVKFWIANTQTAAVSGLPGGLLSELVGSATPEME